MKKRLFIAINLPEQLKDKIESVVADLAANTKFDNFRFSAKENWHITITFLGDQNDAALIGILKSLEEISGQFSPFEINISDISYGPKGKGSKMIWLNCGSETNSVLSVLKKELDR